MSHRPEHVASMIRLAVQSALGRGLQDPRIRGLVSVTRVEVEPDLSRAAVHVSVLPGEHGELTVHGLRHAARRIRAEIGKVARMRRIPRLSFHLDESIKKQAELDAALAEARRPEETEEQIP